MNTKKSRAPSWLDAPEEHDYPAAASYLNLTIEPKKTKKIVAALRKTKISHFKAKDIFRASGLSLLGISNSHVEKDSKKSGKARLYRLCCWYVHPIWAK